MSWLKPLSKPNSLGRTLHWSLPRGLPRHGGTCPRASRCLKYCYGAKGRFVFKTVQACHKRNYELSLCRPSNPAEEFYGTGDFVTTIAEQLDRMRKPPVAIRIHSTGDFYSQDYLDDWVRIADLFPNILFYCYTASYHLDWTDFDAVPNTNRVMSNGGTLHGQELQEYCAEHNVARCVVWPKQLGPLTPEVLAQFPNAVDGSHDDYVAATAKAGTTVYIKEH